MLLRPGALFKLKVFITSANPSAVVGDKKNAFVFFFIKKELKVFLALEIFLAVSSY